MENIYSSFFNSIITVFKGIGYVILVIVVFAVQIGLFLFSTAITLLVIKMILDALGINLGINF